jgi:hypothetical protein
MRVQSIEMHAISSFDDEKTASGQPARRELAHVSEPGRYRIGIFRRRAGAMGSSGSIPFICHDAMKTCLQDSCQAKPGD